MPFTPQDKERIIAAIKEKAPQFGRCVICGQANWSLQDGFVTPTLQSNLKSVTLGGTVLPSIALTCSNCGNTHLLNVIVLGLRDLLDKAG